MIKPANKSYFYSRSLGTGNIEDIIIIQTINPYFIGIVLSIFPLENQFIFFFLRGIAKR